jgi:dTDP-4-amino-4,6-dideoxygalactose transaminase
MYSIAERTQQNQEFAESLAIQRKTRLGEEMMRPLYVTRPLLPDLSELREMLEGIWQSQVVTNCGPLHETLEAKLSDFLKTPSATLYNNATIALLCALKLFNLPLGSEVITTPLTFAATAHSIVWNGLKPVFADILQDTLTIDPEAVEKAITSRTSAILAVHVYGTVCELGELARISKRHGLKLIYDAAHAFGTEVDGQGISTFGDASIFSFHATKLFNTLEGGLIATPRVEDHLRLHYLRNFGIKNEEEVVDIGINGKMNEVQAAIGLLNMKSFQSERSARAELRANYNATLAGIPGIRIQAVQSGITQSEQYYPIVVESSRFGRTRDDIYSELQNRGIFSRKYFHPVCTDFVPYKGSEIISVHETPVVNYIKSSVLCLPFFSGVTSSDVSEIGSVFRRRT